ncbi:hypothetical protein E4U49_008192 [Claviceps purpurea]|nr:hypothetical protein E4U49_008192 [Claviceps purpurea]
MSLPYQLLEELLVVAARLQPKTTQQHADVPLLDSYLYSQQRLELDESILEQACNGDEAYDELHTLKQSLLLSVQTR